MSDLNKNVVLDGIYAASVHIEYPGDLAHSIAAFEIVDQGLIFTEPHHEDRFKVRRVISSAKENWYNGPR